MNFVEVNLTESYIKTDKNQTAEELKTILDCLRCHASKIPDREAVVFVSSDFSRESVTWSRLYKKARETATALINLGVKKDEVIAVNVRNCVEWLFIVIGAMMAGVIAVSISFTYTDGSDLVAMMRKLQTCSLLVMDPGLDGANWNIVKNLVNPQTEKGHVTSEQMPYLRYLITHKDGDFSDMKNNLHLNDFLETVHVETELPKIMEDSIAFLFQTSGSTGVPNLVAHTHKAIRVCQQVSMEALAAGESVTFNDRPFAWIGGFPLTLISGVKRVTMSGFSPAPNDRAAFIIEVAKRENCSSVSALPQLIHEYIRRQVGTTSSYSLQWLTPGMWYFIRVGILTGKEYKNLTEVLMTKTKVTDHCLYNGRRVPVGEQLIVDCEESCYCSYTGRFHCVPVCSKQHPKTRACSDTETRENCCDHVQHCSYDTCTYLGKPVQHEYSWVIDCAENCTCHDGSVTCVPLCADVMVPENCSNPVLTKKEDGCCDLYECHELDVCEYMNSSYRVGTWFQSDDCEVCTCTSSREVACVNLSRCFPAIMPEHSVACPDPTLIDNRCCSQIVCDKQSEDYDVLNMYTITKYPTSSSILVRFQFISTKDEQSAIRMTLFYTTDVSNSNFTSWASNVTVKFSDVINASSDSLEFRDFGKPYVLYCVKKNYLLVIPKLFMNIFYYVKLKLVFDKAQKAIPEYIAETRILELPGLNVGAPNHLTTRTKRVHFTAINSSSNSAFVSWTLPEPLLNNISSFIIKYKPFSRTEWQYTERVIFSDTSFMLKCLYHSSWYEAKLISQPGERRLATTFFNTSSIKEVSNSQYSLLLNVSIRASSVIMAWNRLPEKIAADINDIEILWTRSHNEDTLLKSCVSARSDNYVLQDLVPGCIYTVWLGISRRDGTITFTNRMHFVSLHHYSSSHSENQHSIVVAITVACVSLVTMVIAIVTVIYLLKCKHRASYLEHTSFENRIFQIYDNKDDREL